MSTTVVQLRGGKGLTAAEQAYLAGKISEPTQAALEAYLRAPALDAAANGVAQISDALAKLGETTSLKIGEVDALIEITQQTAALLQAKLDEINATPTADSTTFTADDTLYRI